MKQKFTLIELLVVIAIIAILASLLMPSLSKARELGKQAVCKNNLKSPGIALNMFADDNRGRFPDCWVDGWYWTSEWMGKIGTTITAKTSVRPYNTYFGINSDSAEVPVARCPSDIGPTYDVFGSSYVANNGYNSGALGDNPGGPNQASKAIYLGDVNKPSRLIHMGESLFHQIHSPNTAVQNVLDLNLYDSPHGRRLGNNNLCTVLFVDGSVRSISIIRGGFFGEDWSSDNDL